jgi:ferric-dicitrate binding protein FerR (iron transport regulator)
MLKREKEIVEKYISNTASVDEQARAEELFRLGGKDIKDFMNADWKHGLNSDENIEKDLSAVLDKVHHSIHLSENEKKITRTRKLYKWFSAVAAILILPFIIAGITSVVKLKKTSELLADCTSTIFVESPIGSRISFEMPDGSKIVLNGGSSLLYAVPFSSKRDVKLVGEAYFDVIHDNEHPFMVSTQNIDVKVLGTRFSMNAFPDDEIAEVILERGRVECVIGQEKIVMRPNERVRLSGNTITKTYVNAKKYTAWRDGKLIFRGDSMDEVARRISRWYNVDVELKGVELKEYSIRATFQDDSLEEVLRLLELSSPIKCKIVPRKKQADGSFSRKKVLICKKK